MKFAGCLLLLLARPVPIRAQADGAGTELDAYRRVLMDWGGLTRYGSENAELQSEAGRGPRRVSGRRNHENWGKGKEPFFPGKPYVNRGITRQTTAQMLVRFPPGRDRAEAEMVIIEAGSNDIAGVMGPATEGTMCG